MNEFVKVMVFFVLVVTTGACGKDCCSDQTMEKEHSGICTKDCPQICGCDGVTYCNECEANAKGIAMDYQGPCGSQK